MLTIENQLYNNIENGKLDMVELSYLHEQMRETYEDIGQAMTTYFDDDRDKEMLAQWRGRFENKIKEFEDDQAKGVKRKLEEVIQQKKARKKLDEKKTEFENKLLTMSKDLAHQLKDKANDEEDLRKQFNSVWSGCVTELTAGTPPIKDINYVEDQSDMLKQLGFEWALIKKSKSSGSYKKIALVGNYNDYIVCNKTGQHLQEQHGRTNEAGIVKRISAAASIKVTELIHHFDLSSVHYEEQKRIRSLIEDVEKHSLNTIKRKPVATRGYSSAYLQEVAHNLQKKVTEFESKSNLALKKEFTVDLVLYVFDRAESWLTESHKKFKNSNDVHVCVESKKEQYYNIFRSFCKGSSSAVVLGELICEKLKSSTVEAVCNKTAFWIANEMKRNFPAFSGNRSNLEKHVLKSLAEKEDFDGFITYIRNPREQVEAFIKDEVQKYISSKQRDKSQNILKKIAEEIKTFVSQALSDTTEKIVTQRGDIDMWMEKMSSSLSNELTFNTICCQNFSDISDFDFLKEEIEKGLKSIMEEMSSLSLDKMKEFRMKPDQILIDHLCNCCWVKCPFCAAVCTNTLADHSPDKHSVPFHRPSGIKGWHFRYTDQLVIDFCTTLVASNLSFYPHHDSKETFPYKEYPKAGGEYATWMITPDESKLIYWKWFACQFQQQLEDHYELKFHQSGQIPSEWRTHTKEEAIKSLDEI